MAAKRSLPHAVEYVYSDSPSIHARLYARTIEELLKACYTYYSNESGRFVELPGFIGVRYKGRWLI